MTSIVELLVRRRPAFQGNPASTRPLLVRGEAGWGSGYASFGKRLFDIIASLVLLGVFAPAILFIAAAVAMDGGRPFVSLRRVGRGGRAFGCWKIRSMVPDAEERLAEVLATDPEAAAEWARDQKLTYDPRITRLGGALRKTSLDELPQLWNVLMGDMSLVGPRPVALDEIARYGDAARWYRSVRPGVTGLWQVQGRNSVSYDERVRLDVDYVGRVTFLRDLAILLRTVGAVLNRTGR